MEVATLWCMPKLYASRSMLYALELLLDGPTCASDIDPSEGRQGWRAVERLQEHGLVEFAYRRGKKRYWTLTEDGYERARMWGVRQKAIDRGECCEDAVLGIEGDHAPYCPFIGATSTSSR